ncbi:MAG: 50S ribosomal protein L9 [Candidatus Omnitrophica bacterium]|nr:50S ribosomal protein L9 [Candidatus Omnitrophota bacterium]
MEVILKQDVDKIGKAGAVVKVKDGYARNFLIPNGLAVPLTSGNLKTLEEERLKKTQQQEKLKKEAEALKSRLSAVSLTIPALIQEEDKLYGSISAQDISTALKEEGFEVDKNAIDLEEPIKALGIYEVPVRLHTDITATVKVWIVKK